MYKLGVSSIKKSEIYQITLAIFTYSILVLSIFIFCDGNFVYILDDPYITMSLGHYIHHGHYGINMYEVSSPSSSIIYPFVLSVFSEFYFYNLIPISLNIFLSLVMLLFIQRIVQAYASFDDKLVDFILVFFIFCATGGFVLPFTGLEHSIHVFMTLLSVFGFFIFIKNNKIEWYMLFSIVVLPLIRFEALALSLSLISGLFVLGKNKLSLYLFFLVFILLGFYFLSMYALDLPLLPSSVLVKSDLANNYYEKTSLSIYYFIVKIFFNIKPYFLIYSLMLISFFIIPFLYGDEKNYKYGFFGNIVLFFVINLSAFAHILFGSAGGFARYEDYVLMMCILFFIFFSYPLLGKKFKSKKIYSWTIILFLFIGENNNFRYILLVPPASRGIYQQQFQMGRFVHEFYRAPVAVNDLGLVSYQNPYYVLDLWGLGSEEVRRAHAASRDKDWLLPLIQKHDVGLAMIYSQWFNINNAEDIPTGWKKIATLKTKNQVISSPYNEVSFYLTKPEMAEHVKDSLNLFSKTIDNIATIQWDD